MARVRELFHDARSNSSAHPTEVEAGWKVLLDKSGERLFQLSTYGSDARRSDKKVSQTIQIDKVVARELVEKLRDTFGL